MSERTWSEIEWSEFTPPLGVNLRGWYRRVGNVVEFRFDEPWWLEPIIWTVDDDQP